MFYTQVVCEGSTWGLEVQGRRLAVWGNGEEAEKPGRGWKGEAISRERKRREEVEIGWHWGRKWVGGFPQQSSALAKVFSWLHRATVHCWAVQATVLGMECGNHGSGQHCPPYKPLRGVFDFLEKEPGPTQAVWRQSFGSLGWLPYVLFRPRACGQWQWKQICLQVTDKW